MAAPRVLSSLGKAALVVLLVVPPLAIWLSGHFGGEADPGTDPPAAATRATLPRSREPATSVVRPPPAPDSIPTPAPPVTVGPGTVAVPPPVPGAVGAPPPTVGRVVGEPQGIPDPNQSEATPR